MLYLVLYGTYQANLEAYGPFESNNNNYYIMLSRCKQCFYVEEYTILGYFVLLLLNNKIRLGYHDTCIIQVTSQLDICYTIHILCHNNGITNP
jgi:hypothetical protein